MRNKQSAIRNLPPDRTNAFGDLRRVGFNAVARVNNKQVKKDDLTSLLAYLINYTTIRYGEVVTLPEGFDAESPVQITRLGYGNYTTDFALDDYITAPATTYYLAPDGDDSNDGLTAGAPKKSLSALVTAINAAPEPTTFILAAGAYVGTDGLQGVSIGFDCNILCPDGAAVFRPAVATEWTKTSGRTNLWQATQAGNPAGVDLTEIDEFGIPRRLQFISGGDIAAADATPGSIAFSGSTAYVHTYDGREPDANILVFETGTNGWVQTSARNVTMQNVLFWGWEQPALINHSGGGRYIFDGCDFNYSRSSKNGFETSSSSTSGMIVILHKSRAAYNRYDGFGYRGSHRLVEIECLGVWNGWGDTNPNDNGSTTHGSVRAIRVMGVYRNNDDRNVHDINSTRNVMYGSIAGDAMNALTTPYDNAAFICGGASGTDSTRSWLIECTATGGSISDAVVHGTGALMVLDNCTGFNNTFELNGGTLVIIPASD